MSSKKVYFMCVCVLGTIHENRKVWQVRTLTHCYFHHPCSFSWCICWLPFTMQLFTFDTKKVLCMLLFFCEMLSRVIISLQCWDPGQASLLNSGYPIENPQLKFSEVLQIQNVPDKKCCPSLIPLQVPLSTVISRSIFPSHLHCSCIESVTYTLLSFHLAK